MTRLWSLVPSLLASYLGLTRFLKVLFRDPAAWKQGVARALIDAGASLGLAAFAFGAAGFILAGKWVVDQRAVIEWAHPKSGLYSGVNIGYEKRQEFRGWTYAQGSIPVREKRCLRVEIRKLNGEAGSLGVGPVNMRCRWKGAEGEAKEAAVLSEEALRTVFTDSGICVQGEEITDEIRLLLGAIKQLAKDGWTSAAPEKSFAHIQVDFPPGAGGIFWPDVFMAAAIAVVAWILAFGVYLLWCRHAGLFGSPGASAGG